jgi:hypothetical protein
VFSDSFSEGQVRDINGEFPSDSNPYTEHYDYLSDSDLEDESSCSEEEDDEPSEDDRNSRQSVENAPDPKSPKTPVSDPPPPRRMSAETSRRNDNLTRMGKVAIIRDMGAAT